MEQELSLQPETEAPKDPFANLTANPWPEAEPIEVVPIVEPPDNLIATIDGIVYPAIYKVNNEYCYTEADKERLITYLKDNGVKVKVEQLDPVAGLQVTKGIKYNSVDEAVNHIKGAAPESLIIPYLKEQLQATESWLAAALTKLDIVETVNATLAEKVEALEVKTADTIKEADEPIIKK